MATTAMNVTIWTARVPLSLSNAAGTGVDFLHPAPVISPVQTEELRAELCSPTWSIGFGGPGLH